ncbi:MAG: nitroreductase family protein [Desulfobacterium sp.]|nr:nitroreductase family protein [Desulfobacterium sp.]
MFFDLIQKRRSIRKFKPVPVEREKINRLIETALRSPSSRGFNPWRFVVVDQPSTLAGLSLAKPHSAAFLKDAPLAIVVVGDPQTSDVWIEDCSIASAMIHLGAQALGLGSCWIQIRRRDHDKTKSSDQYVKELLSIPDNLAVESILAIGYGDEVKDPHSAETLEMEKVHLNRYGE